jgi:predicted metal-dependent phosphoesterase TrpH
MPITLDDITSVDHGARFFSADIHVHSYGASLGVKDPSMTVEAIIDTAIKEDISILAIADHNTDANVARAHVCGRRKRRCEL